MKVYFFELAFDLFYIRQITKHVFVLRSTFFIEDFHFYFILVFISRFLTIFRAKGPPFRLHFYKENPFEIYACKTLFFVDGFCSKIANEES